MSPSTAAWAATVIVADQATKILLPIIVETSHISMWLRVAALSIFLIVYWRWRASRLAMWAAILAAAGASNLFDILAFGHVRDIFFIGTFAFNVADAALLVGAAGFIASLIRQRNPLDTSEV